MEIIKIHRSNTTKKNSLMALIATLALFSTMVSFAPLANVYASTNIIEDFEDNESSSSNEEQVTDESNTGQKDSENEPATSEESNSNQSERDDDIASNQPTVEEESNTNASSGSGNQTIQLVDPNAYTYQTNPAKSTVEILVSPTQFIRSVVKDSFSHGVPNIPIEVKVKDPANTVKTFSGTTDSNGRNQITVPVVIEGVWSADVTIKSPPSVGGPFTDTITWNAILTNQQPPNQPPNQPVGLQYDSQIAYQTVDRSNDPRQQILTTVKDSAGAGVKDVKLTIKLTNSDGQSATFSRITDANGVDEFVTPVEKDGDWKAFVSVKDSAGNVVFTKEHIWKAIP